MFSSFFPWEFKSNYPTLLKEGSFGLYAFSCYDPFLEKIFLNSVPEHFLDGGKWSVVNAQEITVNWLEDNLKTLDFFSSGQSYKVLMSEILSTPVQDFLLNEDIDWGNRYFLLNFIKENKFFDKLKKKQEVHCYKIKTPNFWENDKLMKFICEQMSLPVSYRIQSYLVEHVPAGVAEYIHILKKLTFLGRPIQSLSIQDIQQELERDKFDTFLLARLWGSKKHQNFFEKILPFTNDFLEMIKFFGFMQSHILKMVDTSYMASKSRPSKYDREIELHSKIWDELELRDELKFFGKCELLAKQKSSQLRNLLRLRLISSYQKRL